MIPKLLCKPPVVSSSKEKPGTLIGRLDHLANQLKEMAMMLGSPEQPSQQSTGTQRETVSLMMQPQLLGREKEKMMVIQMLLQPFDSRPRKGNLSILPIVGNRGIGKTTLAKHVYNDQKVTEQFKLRVWVSASKLYDEVELSREIVLSNFQLMTEQDLHIENVTKALKILKSKRILIVLDDLQNGKNLDHWKRVCSSISKKLGIHGSVMLVTTQSKTVAETVGTMDAVFLGGLSDDICWSFVRQWSFGKDEMDLNPDLRNTGKEIIAKLKGSPLAAKIMGGTLNKLASAEQWPKILRSKIWQLLHKENHIPPALLLSYLCFPRSLKRCFSLCCIFPKGYALSRDLLISFWIADGTIAPQGDAFMEDLGSEQFNELVGRFFIEETQENPSLFVMHDLIHELSQTISRNESIYLDDTTTPLECSSSIRHLSVNTTKFDYEWIRGCKQLRSLLFLNAYDLAPVLKNLLNELKWLRMLYLSQCNLTRLPDQIGKSKHLQFLDVSYTRIRCLPESFCELYNLKVLDINYCPLESFPPRFSQLINLRIIRTSMAINTMIKNFGNLTSLENLSHYSVQRDYGVIDLGNMTRLRGSVAITKLENCWNEECAAKACLSNKINIVDLTLEWSRDARIMEGARYKIIKHLEPHPHLKKFQLKYYQEIEYPSWLRTKRWPYLSHLVMEGCLNLGSLRWWLTPENLPVLKLFCMIHCEGQFSPTIKNFDTFSSLECLEVRDCLDLTYHEDMSSLTSMKRFVIESCQYFDPVVPDSLPFLSSLRYLVLKDIPNIQSLSSQNMGKLVSLEELVVCTCDELRSIELEGLTSLKTLSIKNCPKLIESVQCLPSEEADVNGLPQLSDLTIDNTCLLKLSWLRTPPCSLKTLTISNSPEQIAFDGESRWLQGIKSSLKKLIFSDCGNLVSLSKDIVDLVILEHLSISGCPKLKPLTESSLPPNLLFLRIDGTIVWPEQLSTHGTSTSNQLMIQYCEPSCSTQKSARKRQRGNQDNNRTGGKENHEMEFEEAEIKELAVEQAEEDAGFEGIEEEAQGGLEMMNGDSDDEDDSQTKCLVPGRAWGQLLPEVCRAEDKEKIIRVLLQLGKSHRFTTDAFFKRRRIENVSTLPIAGVGGVGKTTLAELVYSDQKVQDHFPLKFWCSVSGSFESTSVYKLITGNEMLPVNSDDPKEIWEERCVRQKFLLVLDDVRNVDGREWQQFCKSLKFAPEGSMILVTTCSEEVAEIVGTMGTYALEGLPENTYEEFFNRCVFSFEEPTSMSEHESIKRIALKMEGSPLAAKVLGAALNMDFNREHWDDITQRISALDAGENNNIQVALELGYEYLPGYLKKCFTFFSCFPDGYNFDEDALISMWVAVGMIKPEEDILVEEMGSYYLEELARRSLIQQSRNYDEFRIHHMIHEIIRKKAISPGHYEIKEEGIYIQDPYVGNHLSICKGGHSNELMNSRTESELHSLLVLNGPHPIPITPSLFSRLKMLRLLVLRYCEIEEIPDSIGELNDLCYLDISHSKARYLPDSICDLRNLEILDMMNCPLNELPRGITKLQKLRRLRMKEEMFSKIPEIGKLTSLQDLPQFCVLKMPGYRINELMNMKQLHRSLWIKNLENMEIGEETSTSILYNKGHLDSLILEWSLDRSTSFGLKCHDYFLLHNKVLESLVPHPNLKVLQIANYCGSASPSWLHTQMLPLLSKIWLKDCYNMRELSLPCSLTVIWLVNVGIRSLPFIRDTESGFPALSELHIERCPNLTNLGKCFTPELFPNLKSLYISNYGGLVFLPEEFEGFRYLENLDIRACPNLKCPSTLVLPSGVRKLALNSCGDLEIVLPGFLENLKCLNTLDLAGFPHITSLQLQGVQSLKTLRSLAISSFIELSRFEGLSSLSYLKELSIFDCPKLVQPDTITPELNMQEVMSSLEKLSVDHTALLKLPGLKNPPPTLQILQICNSPEVELFTRGAKGWLRGLKLLRELSFLHCGQVQLLPSDLYNLISLESLCLNDCPEIKSLPGNGLPKTLRNIKCINCHPQLTRLVENHNHNQSL